MSKRLAVMDTGFLPYQTNTKMDNVGHHESNDGYNATAQLCRPVSFLCVFESIPREDLLHGDGVVGVIAVIHHHMKIRTSKRCRRSST